jgi:predicted secreted hydrolase
MPVVPPIVLPRDQYAHPGAPKEWWWHTGTLRAGKRLFGFEINPNGRWDDKIQYVELMVTDVHHGKHYHLTAGHGGWNDDWAESDPSKPWYARMKSNASDLHPWALSMTSELATPYTLRSTANFVDAATGTHCTMDLTGTQNGPPLLVWGTGSHEANPNGTTPLTRNNYYYSFTKVQTQGTLSIGKETFAVDGLTWFDHEYGAFPSGTRWVFATMQLDNGYHLDNFIAGHMPVEGERIASHATLLLPEGDSIFVDSFLTPLAPLWTDPKGLTYCTCFLVEIPQFDASVMLTSLMGDQQFRIPRLYEGVARVQGSFGGRPVTGTGWIEQVIA